MKLFIKRAWRYINPIEHLGEANYSIVFPFVTNISLCILSEFYAYMIAKNPMVVGTYIIFINAAFIIYFAFRDAIRGGFIAAGITVLYYLYIIYTRHYTGQLLSSGLYTTFLLGVLYILLAAIIGWLRQTIDDSIEREADEKMRLRTILDQLAVGVVITDKKGKVIQANRQLEKIFGVKIPIGYIAGKDEQQSPLYQSLKEKKPVLNREFTIQRRNGKKVHVQISSSVIRNKKREIIAAASIITDITAKKEQERQKDDFLSLASHELKTPITSLKMFVDLQRKQLEEHGSPKAKYFNERIRDQTNQLKELTNDLLDVSRIQTGKLRFANDLFSISEIIRDTVEGLQGTTQQHKIVIEKLENYVIHGDRYRIYQVFVNLLTNAIKYSSNGKKIIVGAKKEKRHVVVHVQDFGIGIDKEQQDKIFNKLYQVTDSHVKTFPGLGLGLYISREIITRHNGKIWVESELGKGSTFYFRLPLAMQSS